MEKAIPDAKPNHPGHKAPKKLSEMLHIISLVEAGLGFFQNPAGNRCFLFHYKSPLNVRISLLKSIFNLCENSLRDFIIRTDKELILTLYGLKSFCTKTKSAFKIRNLSKKLVAFNFTHDKSPFQRRK